MTDEEMNTTIAKAVGWTKCDPVKFVSDELWHLKGRGFSLEKDLPDYVNDLNEIHKAEKVLNVNQLSQYADELDKVCVPVHICPLTHWSAVAMATARQRAEAFIAAFAK